MKKLKKLIHKEQKSQVPERITNDTVSEHRKRILAGGRKFKYPLQYSRHKLVINTTIIIVVFLVIAGLIGWWQLYPQQNTSQFSYRITTVVPIPVARVDGENVRYSDYLMKYRSNEHYLQQKEQAAPTTDGGDQQRLFWKRESIDGVIADAYAAKLAREMNISELQEFIKESRSIAGSEITERTHYAVIRDYYNWSPSEYEHVMRTKLLLRKVVTTIDETARKQIDEITRLAINGEPWSKIVEDYRQAGVELVHGSSGMVPKTNQDGGMAAAAAKLPKDEVSDIITSPASDGYYYSIVRLIDSNESQVNYEFLQVPLVEFKNRLKALYDENKVKVYINIPREEEGEA